MPALRKDKKRKLHTGHTSIRDVIAMLKWRRRVASQRIQDFLEVFSTFSNINEVLSCELEKESNIRVRMG